MKLIHRHYAGVARELAQQEADADDMVLPSRNHAVVLVSKLHLPTLRALAYARATRPDNLEAITVSVDDGETKQLVSKWQDSDITVPLKVIASPYREITRPVLDYVKRITKDSPRDGGHGVHPRVRGRALVGADTAQPERAAAQGQTAVRAQRDGDFGSVATQFVGAAQDAAAAVRARGRQKGLPGLSLLTLRTEAPANGGSCVARDDGRVVFVRYALPGETVRARVTSERGSYWHAEAVEIVEASPDRIDPLCPIAGADGAGCCDMAFVEPSALRALKGEVVANQLQRLGGLDPAETADLTAEPVGSAGETGWRTRVRVEVGADGRAGFHRYHSAELVDDLRCAQLPSGMLGDLPVDGVREGDQLHVVLDDDGMRHVVSSGQNRRTRVLQGEYEGVQRVGGRVWRLPVTAFWQAHRDAATVYSALLADWAGPATASTAWDLYGGAGLFAHALAEGVGHSGRVISVDTSRAGARAGRVALADLPQVRFVTESVRRALHRLNCRKPNWPCSIRRGRVPAARSSTWSRMPACSG